MKVHWNRLNRMMHYFHDRVKLWVFLPSAVPLFAMWVTVIYLFVVPLWERRKRVRAGES